MKLNLTDEFPRHGGFSTRNGPASNQIWLTVAEASVRLLTLTPDSFCGAECAARRGMGQIRAALGRVGRRHCLRQTRSVCARERSDRSNPLIRYAALWIASRSLSSGARSRDPLARNDGAKYDLALRAITSPERKNPPGRAAIHKCRAPAVPRSLPSRRREPGGTAC